MPSVRTYNQTAPFWDFIADLENQGNGHPFFNANRGAEDDDASPNNFNPWAGGFGGWPFGPMPHRGRHGGPGPHHQGPPPPLNHDHHHGPPPPPGPPKEPEQSEAGPSEPRGPPPPFSEEPPHHGPGQHRRHGRCGGRGGWGGRGRGSPRGFPMGGAPPFLNNLAEMFQSQLFGGEEGTDNKAATEDLKPEVDIFDTTDSFVVHISLPGAKKEDVGVNWDAEKSELSIAGVIYRPGDEELLKTLALDERRVGAFERKVRLGSRPNPAQVDVDGISARMEDGVLRVEVPKLDSGYVEIKKVDIE